MSDSNSTHMTALEREAPATSYIALAQRIIGEGDADFSARLIDIALSLDPSRAMDDDPDDDAPAMVQ